MRGRLGTKAELDALDAATKFCESQGLPLWKQLRSLYEKLAFKKAHPVAVLTPISHLETALVEHSRGKVLPLEGATRTDWIIIQNMMAERKATVEQARVVGAWLSRQAWLSPTTIDQVAKKWATWLTKAQAEHATVTEAADGWKRSEL